MESASKPQSPHAHCTGSLFSLVFSAAEVALWQSLARAKLAGFAVGATTFFTLGLDEPFAFIQYNFVLRQEDKLAG